MTKSVNIVSSVGEAEKKIAELTKQQEALKLKKQTKLADYERKLKEFVNKIEADKQEKITPMDAEITRLAEEIEKYQKMKEFSLKYEQQLKQLFETGAE